MIRPAGRPFAARAVAAVVLLAAVTSCQMTASDRGDAPRSATPGATFTLVQMNLCLSGLAGCFDKAGYPDIVDGTVARIRVAETDAVTVNEACRRDAVRIARRTDHDVRFVPVEYAGAPLPCVDPGGRGLFGLAVLTRRPIVRAESEAFVAQAGLEERRWLCVSTDDGVDVCTAHLETPDSNRADAANDAQCAELRRVLARRASRVVLFGGDLNRRNACAPRGSWSRTDAASDRLPGVQHIYGSPAFDDPVVRVRSWPFSDHDLLLVRAQVVLRPPRGPVVGTASPGPGRVSMVD
jgi:endonuclease/exonuclease/phosphatase family metal-dependent hydrolase